MLWIDFHETQWTDWALVQDQIMRLTCNFLGFTSFDNFIFNLYHETWTQIIFAESRKSPAGMELVRFSAAFAPYKCLLHVINIIFCSLFLTNTQGWSSHRIVLMLWTVRCLQIQAHQPGCMHTYHTDELGQRHHQLHSNQLGAISRRTDQFVVVGWV